MFKLHFHLRKRYIAAMFARNIAFADRHADLPFLNKCRALAKISRSSVTTLLLLPDGRRTLEEFWRTLGEIEEHQDTKRIFKEALMFRREVEAQWSRNRRRVANELALLLRMPIPRDVVNVFTTHPAIPTGYSIPELHAICWGHKEEFDNYHSIYLTHELLHLLLPADAREVSHAIIELIADNELRIRLNGGGKYFQFPGHSYLLSLERKLFPLWQRYLRRRSGSILGFIRQSQKLA